MSDRTIQTFQITAQMALPAPPRRRPQPTRRHTGGRHDALDPPDPPRRGLRRLNLLLVVVGWLALVSPQRNRRGNGRGAGAARADPARRRSRACSSHGPTKQPAIHTADLYRSTPRFRRRRISPTFSSSSTGSPRRPGVEVLSISPQTGQASADRLHGRADQPLAQRHLLQGDALPPDTSGCSSPSSTDA